jgi:hypothetical protein
VRRTVLTLILTLSSLGFAPAPWPRPRGGEPPAVQVTVQLRTLDAALAAVDCDGMLGSVGQVAVDPISNSLILRGRKSDVDRALAAIKQREGASPQ